MAGRLPITQGDEGATVRVATERGSLSDIARTLAGMRMFSQVPHDKLEKLISHSFVRTYKDGEAIIREGEHGHSMFILLGGMVRLEATGAGGGARAVLERLSERGSVFGEGAVGARAAERARERV